MSQVPAATRALRVLRFLAGQPDPVALDRIMRAIDLPRSTTYHLLHAMIEEGFVVHLPEEHRFGLGPAAFQVKSFKVRGGMSLMQAVDEIERRMQGHIEAFLLRDDLAMTARIRPRDVTGRKPYPGDYDHLARTDEWTLTAGVDDP